MGLNAAGIIADNQWYVDGNVSVFFNQTPIYTDDDRATELKPAIEFQAKSGDTLTITAVDSFGNCRFIAHYL